jgi:hypothetical protein
MSFFGSAGSTDLKKVILYYYMDWPKSFSQWHNVNNNAAYSF